jgi:hypothetical protein
MIDMVLSIFFIDLVEFDSGQDNPFNFFEQPEADAVSNPISYESFFISFPGILIRSNGPAPIKAIKANNIFHIL